MSSDSATVAVMAVQVSADLSTILWQVDCPVDRVNVDFVPVSAWISLAHSLYVLRRQ